MMNNFFSMLKDYIKKLNERALAQQRLQLQQQIEHQNAFWLLLLRKTIADAFNQLPEYLRLSYRVYPNSLHMNYSSNSCVASLRVSDASKYTRVKCHELAEELNNILKNRFYESLVDFDNELSSINTYSYESYSNYFSDYCYRLIYCNIVSASVVDNTLVLRFKSDFTKYNSYYPSFCFNIS